MSASTAATLGAMIDDLTSDTDAVVTRAGTRRRALLRDGGFGGGQIGYNWQSGGPGGYKDGPAAGNFVFGIEADIQGADISGSETVQLTALQRRAASIGSEQCAVVLATPLAQRCSMERAASPSVGSRIS